MKQLLDKINDTMIHLSNDHIDAFSAKAAFFIMMSFFPFLMFVLNFIKVFAVYDVLMDILSQDVFPGALNHMLISVINEISQKASGALLSVSALLLLWSSSTGMLSVSRGLNVIYRKNETRNYFILRAISCFYTVLMAALLGVMLIIMVFGNRIMELIFTSFPKLKDVAVVIMSLRTAAALVILIVFFTFVYSVTPNGRNKIKYQLPGAVFSAAGWLIFSYLFSYYIDNFSNYSYIYGSLTAILLLMLWLYFCMYIMFIGAELNMYLYRKKHLNE